jgi:hypothetical protein
MRVSVRFRFNLETGQVEEFLVVDLGAAGDRLADHDAEHERIAHEVGSVIQPLPRVVEVTDGDVAGSAGTTRGRTSRADVEYEPDRDGGTELA